jgi:hypothetical protein
MRNEIWDEVGSLHVPVGWNGFKLDDYATHYELTLEKDFWGINLVGNFKVLTEIAVLGHACVVVRRDRYFEVGGYHKGQANYAGDENYLDLKFSRFGLRNYTDPRAYILHCSQRHMNYTWTNQDVVRNNMISAYTLGGRPWLDRVYEYQLSLGRVPEHELTPAREMAIEAGESDRAWIEQNASYTLEEVLAGFKERNVPH